MRRLPTRPSKRQKIIIEAVNDFFGERNQEEKKSATKIALWLMGRRKGVVLTEEEEGIKEAVKNNLPSYNLLLESPVANS